MNPLKVEILYSVGAYSNVKVAGEYTLDQVHEIIEALKVKVPYDNTLGGVSVHNSTPKQVPATSGVVCGICKSGTYDNTQNKKSKNSPDYRCKNPECKAAMWLTQQDMWNKPKVAPVKKATEE